MRPTERIQMGTMLIAALTGMASISLAILVPVLSPAQIEGWELVGALLGLALVVASGSAAAFAVRDVRRAYRSSAVGVYSVAQRLLIEACCRLAGKTCLAAALLALWGTHRWPALQRFLRLHPLAFFLLVLEAVVLLTVAHLFTAVWDHEFDKEQRQHAEP